MNTLLIGLAMLICGVVLWMFPVQAPSALAVCVAVSLPTLVVLTRAKDDRRFLWRVFILAVLARIVVAAIIFRSGGENFFAIQLMNASVGSATAIVIYYAAQTLFSNVRVSRVATVLVAFFPSLILWSSQGLKDGLIILALALGILATLRLMDKISVGYVIVLAFCLLGLLSLRFYIFYMMVASIVGSFVLGAKTINAQGFIQRFIAIAAIGLAFTWFGVLRDAGMNPYALIV